MKPLLYLILILALLGAADAGYLLFQTVSGKAVICPNVSIGRFNLNQCNIVLATPYAKFLGFPVALYGFIAYLLFAILALYEFGGKSTMFILTALASLGLFTSAYMVYLQFFVINALCFYCLVSAALMTLIFALSIVYNSRYSALVIT